MLVSTHMRRALLSPISAFSRQHSGKLGIIRWKGRTGSLAPKLVHSCNVRQSQSAGPRRPPSLTASDPLPLTNGHADRYR